MRSRSIICIHEGILNLSNVVQCGHMEMNYLLWGHRQQMNVQNEVSSSLTLNTLTETPSIPLYPVLHEIFRLEMGFQTFSEQNI